MKTRLAYTRVAPLPTDCGGCAAQGSTRAFCGPCAAWRGLPDCWRCGDKKWAVQDMRWVRCPCTTTKEARNEE